MGNNLYVGGKFDYIGNIDGMNNIAAYDGANWFQLGGGLLPAGTNSASVYSILTVGYNLYVSGNFSVAGGKQAFEIARWDQNNWWPLGSGTSGGIYPEVRAMAMIGTDLYIGGRFVQAGEVTAYNFAKWNGETYLPVGNGVNDDVFAMLYAEPYLYIGGNFINTNGGISASKIATYGGCFVQPPSPCPYKNLGSGSASNQVYAIAFHNSQLHAAGNFVSIGGTAANYIARWNGFNWWALGEGLENQATSLCVFQGYLYVGGYFIKAGGISSRFIARWSGNYWVALPVNLSTTGYVQVLRGFYGTLYVGGYGFTVGGSRNIVGWDGVVSFQLFFKSKCDIFFLKMFFRHTHHSQPELMDRFMQLNFMEIQFISEVHSQRQENSQSTIWLNGI